MCAVSQGRSGFLKAEDSLRSLKDRERKHTMAEEHRV